MLLKIIPSPCGLTWFSQGIPLLLLTISSCKSPWMVLNQYFALMSTCDFVFLLQVGSTIMPLSPEGLFPAVGMHSLGEEVRLHLHAELGNEEEDDSVMMVDSYEDEWGRLHDVKVCGTVSEHLCSEREECVGCPGWWGVLLCRSFASGTLHLGRSSNKRLAQLFFFLALNLAPGLVLRPTMALQRLMSVIAPSAVKRGLGKDVAVNSPQH